MTTSSNDSFRHWSIMLRLLAPGPVALGMRGCLDPSFWRTMRARREAQAADR